MRDRYSLRRQALLTNVPHFTTMAAAIAVCDAMEAERAGESRSARSKSGPRADQNVPLSAKLPGPNEAFTTGASRITRPLPQTMSGTAARAAPRPAVIATAAVRSWSSRVSCFVQNDKNSPVLSHT